MYTRWRKYGRSFDLGRMTLRDLLVAYGSHPAIHIYLALSLASLACAVHFAAGPLRPLAAVAATLLAYPLVWYGLHRFVLHSRLLYR